MFSELNFRGIIEFHSAIPLAALAGRGRAKGGRLVQAPRLPDRRDALVRLRGPDLPLAKAAIFEMHDSF